MEGVLRSHSRTREVGINNFSLMPRPRLPGIRVITQVRMVGYSYRCRRLFTVSIALRGQEHEHEGSAGARNERLGHNTPDPHSAERDPEIRDRREGEGQGSGVQQPPETVPGHTLGGDQDGRDLHDLVRSEKPRGEPWCSGNALVCIDHCQLGREVRWAGLLALPQLGSISRRGRPKRSVPSKPP